MGERVYISKPEKFRPSKPRSFKCRRINPEIIFHESPQTKSLTIDSRLANKVQSLCDLGRRHNPCFLLRSCTDAQHLVVFQESLKLCVLSAYLLSCSHHESKMVRNRPILIVAQAQSTGSQVPAVSHVQYTRAALTQNS